MLADEGGVKRLANLDGRRSSRRPYPQAEPGPARVIDRLGIHHGRRVQVGDPPRLGAGEPAGRHADDLTGRSAKPKCLTDHVRIARETASPEVVAQHDDGVATWYEIVTRRDETAGRGPKTKAGKHIPGHILPNHGLRTAARADGHIDAWRAADDHDLGAVAEEQRVFAKGGVVEDVLQFFVTLRVEPRRRDHI